jgi:hypothetical protein
MVAHDASTRRLLAWAMAAILIVAGCGGTASQEASATARPPEPTTPPIRTPSPPPTPSPRPKTTPSPSPSANLDTASALKIGAPYTLVDNRYNTALSGSFVFDVAGQHLEVKMNGREIRRDGALVGAALVMKFSGIAMSREIFDAAAQNAANNQGGKVSFATILGNRVAFITTKTTTFGLYVLRDTIVMVGGAKAADAKPLLTSLIQANK